MACTKNNSRGHRKFVTVEEFKACEGNKEKWKDLFCEENPKTYLSKSIDNSAPFSLIHEGMPLTAPTTLEQCLKTAKSKGLEVTHVYDGEKGEFSKTTGCFTLVATSSIGGPDGQGWFLVYENGDGDWSSEYKSDSNYYDSREEALEDMKDQAKEFEDHITLTVSGGTYDGEGELLEEFTQSMKGRKTLKLENATDLFNFWNYLSRSIPLHLHILRDYGTRICPFIITDDKGEEMACGVANMLSDDEGEIVDDLTHALIESREDFASASCYDNLASFTNKRPW